MRMNYKNYGVEYEKVYPMFTSIILGVSWLF